MTLAKISIRTLLLMLPLTWAGCASDGEESQIPDPDDATIATDSVEDHGQNDEASEEKRSDPLPGDTVDNQDEAPAEASKDAAPATAEVSKDAAPAATSMPMMAPEVPTAPPAASAPVAAAAAPVAEAAPGKPYQFSDQGQKMWAFVDHVVVHSEPSASASQVTTIEYGEPVSVISIKHGWAKIGEGQYVSRKTLTDRKSHFYWRKKSQSTGVAH